MIQLVYLEILQYDHKGHYQSEESGDFAQHPSFMEHFEEGV